MPRKHTLKNRRRHNRHKRGGQERDIEMGSSPDNKYMRELPPDPERFNEYDRKSIKHAFQRPGSPDETAAFFEGPTPEEKLKEEQNKMADEDPLNKDQWTDLTIFSDGGSRKTKKNRKRNSRRKRR